jgi:hypothetical protein
MQNLYTEHMIGLSTTSRSGIKHKLLTVQRKTIINEVANTPKQSLKSSAFQWQLQI